jgi:hypothetical protein
VTVLKVGHGMLRNPDAQGGCIFVGVASSHDDRGKMPLSQVQAIALTSTKKVKLNST